MSIGSNLRELREEKKLTQEQVAEKLGVTFQAVSSWERDEYKPDIDRIVKLAEIYEVSVSSIVEERTEKFSTKQTIYNWEHMKTHVKSTARALKMADTLKAVDFAADAHAGQMRKKSNVPYIYHPLNLACHALSMGITDDAIISACLLHDVIEDCGKTLSDLPVSDEAKELVRLLSHEKTNDENRDAVMKAYYAAIAQNPKAALVKCIDRCNNLTTMSWGLSRSRICRMIKETESYFPALLKAVKAEADYGNAAWLLQYQIESMLDIYKRLI
ncbi:MAG: helix-turn-helix domain-containing protein [Lachnospiraceae bacterium]|nr:helix-turn-helix domain-containing protein [Lachnospiraceae bacterium]MCR4927330.1 helix-turn-helix domain-containing protein [Lachnospiraceae bacterium]